MNEPTTDEKIQQLVRAVLEAVDSRLAGVRHELAEFAADVEVKHHQVLSSIAALERRVEHLEQLDIDRAGSAATARERLHELQSRVTELEHHALERPTAAPVADPTPASTPVPSATGDLSVISRPLYTPGSTTRELPIVTDPAIHRLTAPPIPPTVAPTMSPTPAPRAEVPRAEALRADASLEPAPAQVAAPSDDITEDIDIERLKRILDERLSHLTIPHPPEV